MSRNLPPLNALRAFEAAARHLSFTKAAAELNVTPAAVSHQIKALEDYLDVRLFRRLTRALMLTDAGQLALPALGEGFDRIAQGVEHMRRHEAGGSLHVSLAPTFAAKWLMPRFDRFRAAHPEINVRIDAANEVVDLAQGKADIAVRYGPGGYAGMREDRLLSDETMAPICSPALRDGACPLRHPKDLRDHTLLHVNFGGQLSNWPTWEMWLRAAGIDDVDSSQGPVFAQESMAIQAAIAGQGVALASSLFVETELQAGQLVKPFALSLPVGFDYFVISPETTANRPKVRAFREWVLSEAARDAKQNNAVTQ